MVAVTGEHYFGGALGTRNHVSVQLKGSMVLGGKDSIQLLSVSCHTLLTRAHRCLVLNQHLNHLDGLR